MRRWDSRWCWALLLSAGCASWGAPAPADAPREEPPPATASTPTVPVRPREAPPAPPAPPAPTPAPAAKPTPQPEPPAPADPPELRPLRSDEAEVDLLARTEAAIREAHEGLDDADEPLDPTVAGLVEDLLRGSRRALDAGDLDRAHALAVKAATLAAGR